MSLFCDLVLRMGGRTDGQSQPNLQESFACVGVQLITKLTKRKNRAVSLQKPKSGLKLMFNTNKYANEQLANRNFVLGAAFGRLAIGSVDKLLAQNKFQ